MCPMLRVGFALLFGWAATMAQTPPSSDAAQLASRISSLLARGTTVSLEFQNPTGLSPVEWSSFRIALPEELRKAGVQITAAGQPESRVRVFASEGAHGLLLVAEILTGETRQVTMLRWRAAPVSDSRVRITITRKLIWQQAEPILDVLLFDSGAQLLVLGTNKAASYRWIDGKWASAETVSFSTSRPPARDPRGRIEMLGGTFRVDLPGTTCSGELAPVLKVACSSGDGGLPARWITDRNLMEATGIRGAFYSEADGLFAMADGKIADRAGQPFPGADGWGSDIAGVANPCGSSTDTVIVDGAGDDPSRDQIQVHVIADGDAAPASEPMTLPGPVTALWSSETGGQTTLVIRNPKTGAYEAYRLGLACAE
jgi:hypothetical protein